MGRKEKLKSWAKEIAIALVLLFAFSLALNWYRAPNLPNNELPEISGTTIQGEPVEKILASDKPVLIHFWGTWCPVCRQEVDNIESLSQRYPVLSVAVNSGSEDSLQRWMKERGLDYPVLNDEQGRLARRFRVEIFPTTFIYDGKGKLRFVETGYSTTLGLLARMKLAE